MHSKEIKMKIGSKAFDDFGELISKLGESIQKHKEEYTLQEDIKFPIEISGVKCYNRPSFSSIKVGSLVSVRPCEEEYEDKTYLGIYLGDLVVGYNYEFHNESKTLEVSGRAEPALYVFDLNRIVYGCESFWRKIENIENFKEITNEDINNTWYVKLLKEFEKKEQERKSDETDNIK